MDRTDSGVPQCADITPEQVIGRSRDDGDAWLVDQWGRAHPVVSGSVIGRDLDECALGVLHASVSAVHARLRRCEDGSWEIGDQGSLNGTRVNRLPVRRGPVGNGDLLQVGDVCFRFSQRAARPPRPPRGPGRTKRSSMQELPVQMTLRCGDREVTLTRRAEGGEIRTGQGRVNLASLEYALLHALVERRRAADDPGAAFVTSRELAAKLEFRTRRADSDNVRELVRRVRQKLAGLGARDLIESQRGSGYRTRWSFVE